MHDEFLLLHGCGDTFFNTILTYHVIVLITFAHAAGIFDAHAQFYMALIVLEAFREYSQAILTVILLTIGTLHVFVQIKPLTFEALHQKSLTSFLQLIDVFITIPRQQSNVSSINVIRITSFTPDGFEIRTVTGCTTVGKELLLFLG
jgi:succinate dehydrogenase hydrophobic anchor subunit